MSTYRFRASTQYEDLSGTVAADRADTESIEYWLVREKIIREGERLVGASLYVGQSTTGGEPFVQATFLIVPYETDLRVRVPGTTEIPPVVVRRIDRELSLGEFFRFFKRLQLTLSTGGEFEGRSYATFG